MSENIERGSPGRETVGEQLEKNVRGSGVGVTGQSQNRSSASQLMECCGRRYEDRTEYNEHRRTSHGGEGVSSGRRESSL